MAWSRYVAVPAAAALISLLSTGASSGAAAPTSSLGVYRGALNAPGVRGFERWLGGRVGYVLDYVAADSWTTISRPSGLKAWSWARTKPRRYRLVLGVPLVPDTGGSLAEGATGEYDGYFRSLATRLVRAGVGDAILRLGWEFSGPWYRWAVRNDDDARAFAAYWRHVVTTMRGVSKRFLFDWNPAAGPAPFAMDLAYPGDAYVDVIGVDVYDQGWEGNYSDPVARWQTIVGSTYGLAWHRAFARAHHKPMSFPEWGLTLRADGHGGGDDPYFVDQMYAWIAGNRVLYHVYFEFDAPDGAHRLMTGRFPNGAAEFRARFGRSALPGKGTLRSGT